MKLKRLTALLLVLATLLCIVPTTAFAEETVSEPVVTVEPAEGSELEDPAPVEEVPEVPDPAEEAEPETEETQDLHIGYYIDPSLAGTITEADIAAPVMPEETAAATYSTPAAAAAYVRSQYVARNDYFSFTYTGSEEPEDILYLALDHTGSATEGDYIRYQGGFGYGWYGNTYIFSATFFSDASEEKQVTSKVNSILSTINVSGKSDYEKLSDIYDWLQDNVEYDYNGDNGYLDYTAYGALVDNLCVCQGYAVAFYRLALACGIDTRVVTSEAMCHAWNITKVGTKYYYVDATWEHYIYHYYFLKCLANFDHDMDPGDQYTYPDQYPGFAAKYPISTTDYDPDSKDGWIKENGKWYYYENGTAVTGWKKISGSYYFFTSTGAMKTGWLKSGGKWYYLQSTGKMATGWLKISGTYYYFTSAGAMKTGWFKSGSSWYYLQSSGAMTTGWKKISGTYYFFASSGAMYANKWKYSGGNWYYLKSTGAMAKSETLTIGGKKYTFDANGVMQ